VRVAAGDAEGRKSLAGCMLRAPFSLEKTTYDAVRSAVIYRSKLHATLKRQARRAAKIAWAKIIRKVYEVDPLTCPECGAQMRVISLIEDPTVIERIRS
jgi:hypothetical protein